MELSDPGAPRADLERLVDALCGFDPRQVRALAQVRAVASRPAQELAWYEARDLTWSSGSGPAWLRARDSRWYEIWQDMLTRTLPCTDHSVLTCARLGAWDALLAASVAGVLDAVHHEVLVAPFDFTSALPQWWDEPGSHSLFFELLASDTDVFRAQAVVEALL